MIKLRFDQLATMTGGQLRTQGLRDSAFTGIAVDSRTVEVGQLFFAIRGDRNDGHDYIDQAVKRGAAGVVSRIGFFADRSLPPGCGVVEVADTHAAMLKLAGEYVSFLPARRLGVTGSNGKTTTKEFAFRLLSTVEKGVYRSPGNFNNLFGIPLALFAMPTDTRFAILELGISVPGEMDRLASIVRPHLMAITNVGPTHLEFMGSVETVAREKLQAMRYCESGAPLVVNADDPILMAEAKRVHGRPTTFGITGRADFRPDSINPTDHSTVVSIENHKFRLPLFGRYQVYNLLAAYAITRVIGLSLESVDTEGIELSTASMRGEIVEANGITFIADCYNANPESIKAGLESFARIKHAGRKAVVLGDMLELGESAPAFHTETGQILGAHAFDLVITVGPLSRHIAESARAAGVNAKTLFHFVDAGACAAAAREILKPGDLVYLKGSRGIGLESVLRQFAKDEGAA